MGEYLDRAREMRPLIEKAVAAGLDGDDAERAASLFPAWSGAGVAYAVGDRVKYSGLLWRCVQAHTSQEGWTPDAAPSLWARTSDPGEEWPEWAQPTGGHDAYAKGDRVAHGGRRWVSDVDGNVWEPGVYGWTEAE